MAAAAEQFSRGEVLPVADRLEIQEDGLMPDLIRKAGGLGFTGVDAPAAHGGLGLGKNIASRILEFLSLNGSFSVTIGVTSGIAQAGLSLFGRDDQKRRYLPRLVSGESLGAFCLSEPNSGTDALSASTRAEFRSGKWVLNGTKAWVSNAKWAEVFLVMAKIDGGKLSAFLVERGFPGVEVGREEHKLGLKGSSTARVLLDNVELPEENLLHEPGLGHHVALNALNIGRLKLAAMSMGPARDAIGLAAKYCSERRQFGRPISEFGLIRQKLAGMSARHFVAESMAYRTGALVDSAFDHSGRTVDGNRAAAEEFAVECSCCKVFATEAEAWIVDEALQCYGGYGFTEEFPIARHFRDARVSRIYEGTNEINRVFVASRIVRNVKEGRIPSGSGGDSFVSELALRALSKESDDQARLGAKSDLIMLAYAEQSARLRAHQIGDVGQMLYDHILPELNVQAARAFQIATGESVHLPASPPSRIDEIAGLVLAKLGPVCG
jgi:alkylation response protein AidB-like acyl-CoA dehydrogenase